MTKVLGCAGKASWLKKPFDSTVGCTEYYVRNSSVQMRKYGTFEIHTRLQIQASPQNTQNGFELLKIRQQSFELLMLGPIEPNQEL